MFEPRCAKVVDKTCTRPWRQLDLHFDILKRLTAAEHSWKITSAKCASDCSKISISYLNKYKTEGIGAAKFVWSSPHFQQWANVGRFGVTLLLCGFASSCDKKHWHGCAQQSMSDVATLLSSGIATRGC